MPKTKKTIKFPKQPPPDDVVVFSLGDVRLAIKYELVQLPPARATVVPIKK